MDYMNYLVGREVYETCYPAGETLLWQYDLVVNVFDNCIHNY